MLPRWISLWIFVWTLTLHGGECNLPPVFTQDMNNLALSESTPVGASVYRLEGYDPEGEEISFGIVGSDNFMVNPTTGEVEIVKALDREDQDTLHFLVTIKDKVNSTWESQNDNRVEVPISVIVLDENDNAPEFQNVPYETEVLEDAEIGTTVFDKIHVTDRDIVGENLDITCVPNSQNPDACSVFTLKVLQSEQDILRAAVVLAGKLDYNERMIYQIELKATDDVHVSTASLEIRVKDVQNAPPVFQGSLASVINEDSPIGTLVMTIQARDGDRGQPRKILYELVSNPMDYFLLDSKTGELRTAKPLDKEALPDATGLVSLTVRARELVDGMPGNDALTMATTQASVTIRDVNDSPPTFNQKEYFVSLNENTAPGTPLPLEMSVSDPDVGQNSIFSLRLNDVSGVFDVEPKRVVGSSQVSVRVANGTLDYENPNQRKFIVLIIAEETDTEHKLSSTATLTVSVTDANDNRPTFEHDSYSASVSETAHAGQLITTITAKDLDSGDFGDRGIRYSLSGTGAELFHVDPITGAITVAECRATARRKRDMPMSASEEADLLNDAKNVNITYVGQTGVLPVEMSRTESSKDYVPYQVSENDYDLLNSASGEHHNNILDSRESFETTTTDFTTEFTTQMPPEMPKDTSSGPGKAPCLDYETHPVYYLSYKAIDDLGRGQTSVVSLRISLIDANDSPPVCESPIYRASLDEGATFFDPPLFVKARDPDAMSDIAYRIIGSEAIQSLFLIDKRSGQLSIAKNVTLDVNHIHSENVRFPVEASDGLFTTLCDVNITIRDVNNHAPQFTRDNYVVTIAENSPIGSIVERVMAEDLDTGINAEIRYRLQSGSFDDFAIDNRTGVISIARKLDFDRRNTYQMEVVAADLGTPSLSGSCTVTVSILNSNDKAPYFTPATQRAEIAEDAAVGTIVHTLVAIDPDIVSREALDYAATEPITAVDKDGKEVVTGSDEFKDVFSVDKHGNVRVNKLLDRDLFAVIRITVLVTDTTAPSIQQGRGLLVITIIDVNEMPPVFAAPWSPTEPKYTFQMREEQPVGAILTTLQATDADSTVGKYQLEHGNDFFDIDEITGIIRTKARIDYESIKSIHFNATVTDTGIPQLTSTAMITVDVINENDNDPEFNETEYRFEVPENSPRGTIIGRLEASDADDGAFGEVVYSLVGEQSSLFSIDPDTGVIVVQDSSGLDREREPEISITAVAMDKAPSPTRRSTAIPVHIRVKDVNDNAPVFTQNKYQATVAENAALNPPAAILQVTATDPDEADSGTVKYFILSGNDAGMFRLDASTGILYPAIELSHKKGHYQLLVEARDGKGTGPYSDTAEIAIEVSSVNQHRPVFIMPALNKALIEIPFNVVEPEYLVMTVKATDEDSGLDGKVTYHLQVNNDNIQETDEFAIDELSGELRTRKQLERKKQSKYELILVARDRGRPKRFETLRFLTILLVDINENRPEFPDASNPYKFQISENRERDVRIGKIQAMLQDRSHDDPPTIYYYIMLGNEEGAFYIDKTSGDVFTNKSLDRETTDKYMLFILASKKPDMVITDDDRAAYSVKALERDSTVAKVEIKVLDINDNPPVFAPEIYYAGISSKASINELVTLLNITDNDKEENATMELIIASSNLYKFGSSKSTGSIVPSPFAISKDGRLTTATFMAEYNQDRFILEIIAKEQEPPERTAKATVHVWIFNPEQLIRVILSRPPSEVNQEQNEIIQELSNATQKRIIVDDIRYHVDGMGRIRMDWCDLYFHAVDPENKAIVPVEEVLKVVDAHYDFLKDYYAGFAIENVVPAHATYVQEEFDLALAALIALLIILFVGAVSFIVLCCCLKHWVISIPSETRRKDALIKKQIIEDLNTTENPLWIEQKLKLYEEQELTMQVFSEPEMMSMNNSSSQQDGLPLTLNRRDSYETSQGGGDNTYATIQPRNISSQVGDGLADYATLRNPSGVPSIYEFTGSTFQVPQRDRSDFVTELI
ncbi:cadherin-87A [Phlebotomus argentipes]|uniref:cadherin-87A n=1 Tax=Phlebotomus argentipes TaxID=94469 RepID=UPI0028936CF4|nr:cadherin-87A [Phlebotomus argentipes]XP_059616921.1 cadherin-87A [Phlebotomus argentipes]